MDLLIIFSAASLILWAFTFVYFHVRINKISRGEDLLSGYRKETARLIAEIDSATERDSRIVEGRIESMKTALEDMKTVLEDIKKRTGIYVRELEKRQEGERLYSELGKKQVIIPTPDEKFEENAPPDYQIPPTGQENTREPSERTKAGEAVPKKPPHGSPPEDPRILRERFSELARQGFSAEIIASKLGISVSEAELAMALFGGEDG
ncbi:MAG: DUF2802 domain-containing protein [Treponema sp.]|nr:DUF2802 domain-containing protein [Treponema sp.]